MSGEVFIRKIRNTDIHEVFSLSNQPHVRKNSINKEPIKWQEHMTWFSNILEKPDSAFYAVVNDKDQLLGQIRFQIDDNQAVVSISLDITLRGKGYGPSLLFRSMKKLFSESQGVNKVIAYILSENVPSIKLFEGAGFRPLEDDEDTLKYCYTRKD